MPWAIFVLSEQGAVAPPFEVAAAIRRKLPKAEVWVPATVTKGHKVSVTKQLFSGYAFVREGRFSREQYLRLRETRLVESPLLQGRAQAIATVSDAEIARLKAQARAETEQDIIVGDLVALTAGAYGKIPCRVVDTIEELESVCVHIELRTIACLVTVRRGLLRVLERIERPAPQVPDDPEAAEPGPPEPPEPPPAPAAPTQPRSRPPRSRPRRDKRYATPEAIRAAVASSGLTHAQLGTQLGVGARAIGMWCSGKRRPEGRHLEALSAACGVPPLWCTLGA